MKRYHLFGAALGTAALAIAGPVLAANSGSATGFNQYTVNTSTGMISLGSACTSANGCVVLISEPGLLQARVADSTGNQFFQTINTDNPASAGGNVNVDANGHPLEFRNESFVGVGSDNTGPTLTNNNNLSYSVAALTYVDTGSETDGVNGQSYVDTMIRNGNLPSFVSAGPGLDINQQNVVGSGSQQVTQNFEYKKALIASDGFDTLLPGSGASMRIDQTGPINGTGNGTQDTFTLRATSGIYTTTAGSANAGGGAIAYSAGDHIQAIWMTSPVYNADGNGGTLGTNGTFEWAGFWNLTTNDALNGGGGNDNTAPTFDNSGITNVTFASAGPGWWNTDATLTANVGATTDAFPTDPNLALGVVP